MYVKELFNMVKKSTDDIHHDFTDIAEKREKTIDIVRSYFEHHFY